MEYKPLPIGIDNFEKLITKGCYYVDKTLLIKELLDGTSEVNLFTRPRRFGKTLNLSMLRYYFEKSEKDNDYLFDGLAISEAGEKYRAHMGKYPVINLNLKSGKQPDFKTALYMLKDDIAGEFKRHNEILNSNALLSSDKERFIRLRDGECEDGEYAKGIQFLSECLEKAYAEKVVILIDEYDVPLENAYFAGFYEKMIGFIRSLFESALKTNDSLAFAVVAGCLRISRESIFTGLNNLEIISIQNKEYAEHFGFTPQEVAAMLAYYGKEHHTETVKTWYDGYLFGNTEVYNPWSLINYVKQIVTCDDTLPKPFWANTSSNSIIKNLIEKADKQTQAELEDLMAGGTIEKPIHEDITYEDVDSSQNNLWNFLFFTGYLKKISERLNVNDIYATLALPNTEVKSIYNRHIMTWFDKHVCEGELSGLFNATQEGDAATMEEELNKCLLETISFFDSGEAFYHGFMAGIYKGMPGYVVRSNRESGHGRYDLMLQNRNVKYPTILFEFKIAEKYDAMEAKSCEALAQIETQKYKRDFLDNGIHHVIEYGVAFFKKNCRVRVNRVDL